MMYVWDVCYVQLPLDRVIGRWQVWDKGVIIWLLAVFFSFDQVGFERG